eukprot:6019507-Pleurochrysis_carterae.AAC.1
MQETLLWIWDGVQDPKLRYFGNAPVELENTSEREKQFASPPAQFGWRALKLIARRQGATPLSALCWPHRRRRRTVAVPSARAPQVGGAVGAVVDAGEGDKARRRGEQRIRDRYPRYAPREQ